MPRFLYLLLLMLVMASCGTNADGFSELDEGVERKLLMFDEDTKKDGVEYIELGVHGRTSGNMWISKSFLFRNVSAAYLSCLSLGNDIMHANEGDSIAYRLPYACIYGGLIDPWADQSVFPSELDTVELLVSIRSLQSFESYQASLEKMVSAGTIEENKFLANYLVERYGDDSFEKLGDIYFKKKTERSSTQIASGMEIELRFSGHFLNDSTFTNPRGDTTALFFQVGKPDQIIKGIEMAALRLNSGEAAEVFVPSHMGFGQDGSTTGIVPPNTPTYYKLEVYALDSLGSRILY